MRFEASIDERALERSSFMGWWVRRGFHYRFGWEPGGHSVSLRPRWWALPLARAWLWWRLVRSLQLTSGEAH